MAGPLRIEYEGACYHVTNRGNGRRRVFRGGDDYELFFDKLAQSVETVRISLRAFCLMASHFHLAEARRAAQARVARRASGP